MYTPIDLSPEIYRKARKGPRMRLTLDRHRFQRRINQTEEVFGDIFSEAHREKIKSRLLFYTRRETVKKRLFL